MYKMYSHALIQFHYLEYHLKNNFGKQECKKQQGKDPTNCIKLYAMQFTFQYTLVAYDGLI